MSEDLGVAVGDASEPRPAATLVIVRDSPHGPEVLLTLRPRAMRFMGGATVFPGGAVAAADRDPSWGEHSSLSPEKAGEAVELDDGHAALGAYVCALREALEEVGFPPGSGPDAVPRTAADDARGFLESVQRAGVTLRTEEMVAAGRWVTPVGSPVRFDARFFVISAPEGWEPSPDPDEVEALTWTTPARALTELAAGAVIMAPPTVEMLQRLDGYGNTSELLAGVSTRGVRGAGNVLSVRVSPLVHLVLAPNAGLMTGPGTNTYIVGMPGRGGTLVIDPAVDDEEYLDAIREVAGDVGAILVTHRHLDHTGGIAALADLYEAPVRAWGPAPAGGRDPVPLADGEIVSGGGVQLETIHSPGHSSDHVCFFYSEAASLFAGDNVLGEGTAVIAPPDGDMSRFMDTLHRLQSLRIDRIFPGHFKPLDGGTEVIAALIAHRLAREERILEAVAGGAASLDEIVARVYADTPRQLHPVARSSALAHLMKARDDGKVHCEGENWHTAG